MTCHTTLYTLCIITAFTVLHHMVTLWDWLVKQLTTVSSKELG